MTVEMSRLGLLRFKGLARRTEGEVLRLADRVLPVSDVLAERLVDLGAAPDKVHVIRNAADPARYGDPAAVEGKALRASLGLEEDAFVAGFVGFMRGWHRLDLALPALQQDPYPLDNIFDPFPAYDGQVGVSAYHETPINGLCQIIHMI